MDMRVDAQRRGESRFVFLHSNSQHANRDSLEWNAKPSPQLPRSPGMSFAD
jgi:hypothetical protein